MPRDNPAVQLRLRLEVAKRQRVPFDTAWDAAWKTIRWEAATEDRRFSKALLSEQREMWQAAYEGSGDVPGGRVLAALADALHGDAEAAGGDVRVRRIGHMERVVKDDRPRRKAA